MTKPDISKICIYADFNGVEECNSDPSVLCMSLTGYGTLASLSYHKIKLYEGQMLILGDPDDLTVLGQIYFDSTRASDNCSGWFAKFYKNEILEETSLVHDYDKHLCFNCRANIKSYLDKVGHQYKEKCPYCNTSVMYPLLPP